MDYNNNCEHTFSHNCNWEPKNTIKLKTDRNECYERINLLQHTKAPTPLQNALITATWAR